MRFEWDGKKNEANQQKHGLSFDEAKKLFSTDDYLEIYDEEHSIDEDRFIAIGVIRVGVVLVIFMEREEDLIRIISARKATKQEADLYYQCLGRSHE